MTTPDDLSAKRREANAARKTKSGGRNGGRKRSRKLRCPCDAMTAKRAKARGHKCDQKRETNGQYAFDGNLQRVCVCGHTLGNHSAGSPADCLFYSLPAHEQNGMPGADHPDCGCQRFRMKRTKV